MRFSPALAILLALSLIATPALAKPKSKPPKPQLGPQTAEKLLELHNAQRAKEGEPALTIDPKLSTAAQDYAEFLAKSGQFSHNAKGSPGSRIKEAGYHSNAYGENIAKGQKSPDAVVDAWMHSDGHRKNILNKSYHEVGFGYATGAKGQIIWVTDFGSGASAPAKKKHKKN